MAARRTSLGRGLDALLGATDQIETAQTDSTTDDGDLKKLPIDVIQRGKYQPRREMEPEALKELSASIKAQGVMQPIVVREISSGQYEIIAGERRWRASQLAGLDTIPAVIRDVPDESAIAMALIENIQRENLNPLEEAIALDRLRIEFELTQQEVAEAVGKSRTTVANLLRLLALNDDVKILLDNGDLEMGHARALLALQNNAQSSTARTVVEKGLTVRQTEALVQKSKAGKSISNKKSASVDPNIKNLEKELSDNLGLPTSLKHGNKGNGQLTFKYSTLDELDRLLTKLRS